jgi:hypothetical protein
MSILIKRSCAFLLALPLAAAAAPVAVTTLSTGVHHTNEATPGATNSLLNVLGLDPLTSTAPVPYALTLTSTFDTDALPSPQSFWAQAYGDVVIDFRIGTQDYHYAGPASSTAYLAAQSADVEEYSHTVWLDTPNYRYGFVHDMRGPSGSLGEYDPLAPLDVDQSRLTDYSAHLFFNLFAEPIDFSLDPVSATMSVHVAAVPEPASFAQLAAGLGMFALLRMFSHRVRRTVSVASGSM